MKIKDGIGSDPKLLWSHIGACGILELHPQAALQPHRRQQWLMAASSVEPGDTEDEGSELPMMGPGQQLDQGATSNSYIPADFPVCGGGDPCVVQQHLYHEGQWVRKRNWSYKYLPTRDTGSRGRQDRDGWARARLALALLLLLYS